MEAIQAHPNFIAHDDTDRQAGSLQNFISFTSLSSLALCYSNVMTLVAWEAWNVASKPITEQHVASVTLSL